MSICRGAKVVPHRRLFHPKLYQCCLEMLDKGKVETWFRNLSSYNRIDVMCSMLNMCLPFEVRYLGTYVEDRGKIDYNDLRDSEHNANNASRVSELSTLGVSDTRTRRKLILYMSLLHGCNYTCAEVLYKILGSLEDQEIDNILSGTTLNQEQKDEKPLDELLVLYAMAHYHPSFSFEQKRKVGAILEKLREQEARVNPPEPAPSIEANDRIERPVDSPPNCAMPPSPMQQYPDVQMRRPLMSGIPSVLSMPPPTMCMSSGTEQLPMGATNPPYLPMGYPTALSPMAQWQNQTVMMAPMNQMMYSSEMPTYPGSPMVSRQSSPSQSTSPSRSNSPLTRRSNSNVQRWAFDERKDVSSQSNPQVPIPMATAMAATTNQSNVSNSGSTGHLLSTRSTPSQRVPMRESSMTYSRPTSSDSANATGTDKSSKQPPPSRLRSSIISDSTRDTGKDVANFKGNLPNYSHEEIRRLSDEDLRDIGLTPSAVGQLRNIVKSQTTNGLSQAPSSDKKQESPGQRYHPSSPLPPPDCEVSQNNESNDPSAMKPSTAPPAPEIYPPMLHHHPHNNHNMGGVRRYQPMPPMDPSQLPPMYTSPPPPAMYPAQNSCYGCYPVSGVPTRFARCPSHMYCLTQLQNLRLEDNSRQGSQSSSSDSTGSRSPPETPPAAPWNCNITTTISSPTSTCSNTQSPMVPGSTCVPGVLTSVITTSTATITTPVASDGYNSGNHSNSGNALNPADHNMGSMVMTHKGPPIHQMNDRPRHRKGHMMRHKNQIINGAPPVHMPPGVSAFPVSGHSQMTFLPHGHVSLRPNTAMYPNFSGYRPSYPAGYQPNGEIMFPYPPPSTGSTPPPPMPPSTVTVVVPTPTQQNYMPTPVLPFSTTVHQPKISCYNCGSSSHQARDCKDQSMEDLTKRAPYRLDYSTTKQLGDCLNDK